MTAKDQTFVTRLIAERDRALQRERLAVAVATRLTLELEAEKERARERARRHRATRCGLCGIPCRGRLCGPHRDLVAA